MTHTYNPWDRFVERLRMEGDCLAWTGAKDKDNYGRMTIDRKTWRPHRYAWEQCNGPISEDLHINHLCKNRACVKLEHLEVVTPRENVHYSMKPQCIHGHQFDTTAIKGGEIFRACRTCQRDNKRRYLQRIRQAKIDRGETIRLKNGQQTHCPQGHPYDAANTFSRANGKRDCRACKQVYDRLRYAQVKRG